MDQGSLQKLSEDLKSRMSFKNFEISFSNEDNPDLSEDIEKNYIALNTGTEIKFDSLKRTGVINLSESILDQHQEKELIGLLATSVGHIKARALGYSEEIISGINSVLMDIPEFSPLYSPLWNSLIQNNAVHIAIESGYVNEVYKITKVGLKRAKSFIERKGYRSIPEFDFVPSKEHQIAEVVANCYSAPFYATDNVTYGNSIDLLVKNTLTKIGVEDSIISGYERFRDSTIINNPPKRNKIEKQAIELFKLYSEYI